MSPTAESKRPKVGVGVFVFNTAGEVLVQQRMGAHGAGTWSIPGGHLEFGESFAQCASREVREELGVEITNLRQVALTNDPMPEEEKHYITIFMRADLQSGEPRVQDSASSWWMWCAADDLPRPLFLPIKHLLSEGFVVSEHAQ